MIRDLLSFPNQLTLLRLFIIPFIVISLLDGAYDWAFGLFLLAGISDGLDGLLARVLKQKTTLGEYLDPVADKLLLSTMFVALSWVGEIPWRVTILVFSRDFLILVISGVLYAVTNLRDYRPSVFGKLNTLVQVATVTLILLDLATGQRWLTAAREFGIWGTVVLTIASSLHYVFLVGQRLRALPPEPPAQGSSA